MTIEVQMKATEFRIGNWVNINGWAVQVAEISTNHIDTFNDIEPYSLKELEPIPLTKKWIISAKHDGSFRLVFNKNIAAFEVYRKYVGIESGEEWIFISNVRYIHEWQNLHHALTGEELELKP